MSHSTSNQTDFTLVTTNVRENGNGNQDNNPEKMTTRTLSTVDTRPRQTKQQDQQQSTTQKTKKISNTDPTKHRE